jgi:hypothetical protein
MELFELAICLCAEVEPVQRSRERVSGEAVERVPRGLQHDAMDYHSVVIEFVFVFG